MHAFNFYEGGQNVYWVCIFMANITLLRMTHNWTGWGETLMFLAAVTYFPIAFIESRFTMFPILYKFWDESISSPAAWFGAFLAICTLFTLDNIIARAVNIGKWSFIIPAFKTNHFIDLREIDENARPADT